MVDRNGLLVESDAHQITQRNFQLVITLVRKNTGLAQGLQPLMRVAFLQTVLQGINPGKIDNQVHDRLDVEHIGFMPFIFDNKVTKNTDRRPPKLANSKLYRPHHGHVSKIGDQAIVLTDCRFIVDENARQFRQNTGTSGQIVVVGCC